MAAVDSASETSEIYAVLPFETRKNAISDDYEILKGALGKGLNGKVLKCQNRLTREYCAVKVLIDSHKARREVILHKKACESCEYIVKVLAVYENMYESRKYLLIIMECMEGGELFYRIRKRETNPYTERDAARFINMIVQAVAHLHSMNIAHRDLKPENLLCTSKDNDAILKLTDFGFAKECDNEVQSLSTPCFTSYYVAPEVLSNRRYDKACDIWSLGVIMYILLCGFAPFYSAQGNILTSAMQRQIKAGEYRFDRDEWQTVSEEAKNTIKRMLTVEPAERITIGEILQCVWLTAPASDRQIDVSSLSNEENFEQIQATFTSANNDQRPIDDDDASPVNISGPEASKVMKKRTAKRSSSEKKS